MNDDILDRLRDTGFCGVRTQKEAADEIERLRQLTSSLAKLLMPFGLLMTKDEQEMVMKAVRGE